MVALKPYLLRAVHLWAVDSGVTPHVLVDATAAGVKVPAHFVDNGRIVLNVHPRAVTDFNLNDDWLWFSARFSGNQFTIEVPLAAVLAIYAKENGQGISFPEEGAPTHNGPGTEPTGQPQRKGPTLKIIK